jgi:hypothetical protein
MLMFTGMLRSVAGPGVGDDEKRSVVLVFASRYGTWPSMQDANILVERCVTAVVGSRSIVPSSYAQRSLYSLRGQP